MISFCSIAQVFFWGLDQKACAATVPLTSLEFLKGNTLKHAKHILELEQYNALCSYSLKSMKLLLIFISPAW